MMKRLSDGTLLLVRRIRPDDKDLLARGLEQLSDLSVQRRFLGPKRRFTRAELRYLTEIDHRNHVALVVESPAQPSRQLVAVGRFVRLAEDPTAAEVAITVADVWQGRGVGSLISRELSARAAALGIRRFTATIASDNMPAIHLMAKLTTHLDLHHQSMGVSEARIELAA
jgi:RimJ/RimL family protein N-acetyltransferase